MMLEQKMNLTKLKKDQKHLRKRLIEISYKAKTSHLGSCLSAIDIIDAIYKVKKPDEKFILSNGHAAAALYVVLEKYMILKNPSIKKLGVHPQRNPKIGIEVSTGSLGQGLPIALGIALADRNKIVYCMISDGETTEGSIWEALTLASDLKINNLCLVINANGWGGYDPVNVKNLIKKFKGFGCGLSSVNGHDLIALNTALKKKNKQKLTPGKNGKLNVILAQTRVDQLPFLKGQDAHYYVMTKDDFDTSNKLLK